MILYVPLLRSCTTIRSLLPIHAHLLTTGLHRDALLATKLMESYAKMGSIASSRLVFGSFPNPDSFMWGVLIKSYTWTLHYKEAISLYDEMRQCRQLQLSSFIFTPVLQACSGLCDLAMGRKIHGRIIKAGFESDAVIETSLLQMYGEGGGLEDAQRVFDGMTIRDVVSWSSMVSSCIQCGQAEIGLELFSWMKSENVEPDSVMMLKVIEACAVLGSLSQAKSVHGHTLRRWIKIDEVMENSLVSMYSKCGDRESSARLFGMASQRSVVSWTNMISSCNQRSCHKEALEIYTQMHEYGVEPNSVTLVGLIISCTKLRLLKEGKSVHGASVKRGLDPYLSSIGVALINMHSSFGKLANCFSVFEVIQEKTVLSWNSLIAACAQNGSYEKALWLFVQMLNEGLFPDPFTFASALPACGYIADLSLGSQVHGFVAKTGFQLSRFVQNSLIDMYCKCGSPDNGFRWFNEIEGKDVVTWNTMIGGFAQNDNSKAAISLFDQMHYQCLEMDSVTFLTAIKACSNLGSSGKGRWIHHKLVTSGLEVDSHVDTALVDMYAKCGDVGFARTVFDRMAEKNVVSWSVMVSAYGVHGLAKEAILLFSQMVESGVKPNKVTFMGIISACSHAGLVEEGIFYFDLMRKEFGIEPEIEHCASIVDLLSRSGHIDRAFEFIDSMPVEPDASIWRMLLNGCHIHRKNDVIGLIQKRILQNELSLIQWRTK